LLRPIRPPPPAPITPISPIRRWRIRSQGSPRQALPLEAGRKGVGAGVKAIPCARRLVFAAEFLQRNARRSSHDANHPCQPRAALPHLGGCSLRTSVCSVSDNSGRLTANAGCRLAIATSPTPTHNRRNARPLNKGGAAEAAMSASFGSGFHVPVGGGVDPSAYDRWVGR